MGLRSAPPLCAIARLPSALPAPGAPVSLDLVHGTPRVEELALPKSVESGNLSLEICSLGGYSVESLTLSFCPTILNEGRT